MKDDLKALSDFEAELDGILVYDELEWLMILAELSWDPWVYYKEARC